MTAAFASHWLFQDPSGSASGQEIRDLEQQACVALLGLPQSGAQRRPELLRVQRGQDARRQPTLREHTLVVRRWDRVVLHPRQEAVDEPRRIGSGLARPVGVAVRDVRIEGLLEAVGLVRVEVGRSTVGLHGAVQHHRAHLVGKQLGVHAAESGAVGKAEVGELLVADGFTDAIHVACRVDCAEVGELVAVLGSAGLGEATTEVDDALDLVGLGHGVERRVHVFVFVAQALDGMTPADAPRVEAHEVEPIADPRIDRERPRREELDARCARSARIHEQGADPRGGIAGGPANQRELDRFAIGVVVVEWDFQRGAVVVLERVALGPVDVACGHRVRNRGVGGLG